jgi:tRNA 2-thiouridine synthesizing protein A
VGGASAETRFDHIWDAGHMGCGELIVLLRGRMLALPVGGVLQLVARDPGAIEDLPAWCRLTGHVLASADHPVYRIERRRS